MFRTRPRCRHPCAQSPAVTLTGAQDVERWLFLNAISVESAVTLERVSLTLSVSATEGGLEKALQVSPSLSARSLRPVALCEGRRGDGPAAAPTLG